MLASVRARRWVWLLAPVLLTGCTSLSAELHRALVEAGGEFAEGKRGVAAANQAAVLPDKTHSDADSDLPTLPVKLKPSAFETAKVKPTVTADAPAKPADVSKRDPKDHPAPLLPNTTARSRESAEKIEPTSPVAPSTDTLSTLEMPPVPKGLAPTETTAPPLDAKADTKRPELETKIAPIAQPVSSDPGAPRPADTLLSRKEPEPVVVLKPMPPLVRGSDPLGAASIAPAQRPFTIERVLFCQEVHGFGAYELAPADSIRIGKQVLVYCELAGFHSQKTAAGHETHLASMITLETTAGDVVAPIEFRELVDLCQTQRHDFFCHYGFVVPRTLPAGAYVLRVTIRDLHGGQTAEQTTAVTLQPAGGEEHARCP